MYPFIYIHLVAKQSITHKNIRYLLRRGKTSILIHYLWYYESYLEIDLAISNKRFKNIYILWLSRILWEFLLRK